jgi:hypothetical protein
MRDQMHAKIGLHLPGKVNGWCDLVSRGEQPWSWRVVFR